MADTGLSTEAAIALAECLPENHSLVRLDLSRNPNIQIAGLLALSVSIKMNHTITFIDINIPVSYILNLSRQQQLTLWHIERG